MREIIVCAMDELRTKNMLLKECQCDKSMSPNIPRAWDTPQSYHEYMRVSAIIDGLSELSRALSDIEQREQSTITRIAKWQEE